MQKDSRLNVGTVKLNLLCRRRSKGVIPSGGTPVSHTLSAAQEMTGDDSSCMLVLEFGGCSENGIPKAPRNPAPKPHLTLPSILQVTKDQIAENPPPPGIAWHPKTDMVEGSQMKEADTFEDWKVRTPWVEVLKWTLQWSSGSGDARGASFKMDSGGVLEVSTGVPWDPNKKGIRASVPEKSIQETMGF